MNNQQEQDLAPLAPSGVSPWSHVVSMHNGRLTLTWKENGKEHIRTFTNEETENLLQYLYQHRDEIHAGLSIVGIGSPLE